MSKVKNVLKTSIEDNAGLHSGYLYNNYYTTVHPGGLEVVVKCTNNDSFNSFTGTSLKITNVKIKQDETELFIHPKKL